MPYRAAIILKRRMWGWRA